MPANPFNAHTDYGIGIGLRVPHYRHILEKKPVVDWFEIISENFMVDGGRPLEVLDAILEQYRVVQHGVAIYFGSADKLNRDHLKKLKRLVKRTNTPWLSDHLCWGSVDGRYTHDLLPMPYTFAAARVTAQKIREARDFLEVPICVENVSSYAEFHASDMTEWEFLSEVVELADCGILLDVDEATSSLDSESEALIQDGLRSLRKGRTTFVIAHRLSTIRSADQILVLEHGEIVERGTHGELLQLGGRYRTLYDKQYKLEADRFINPGEDFTPTPAVAAAGAPTRRTTGD